jgi:hypothetical protein
VPYKSVFIDTGLFLFSGLSSLGYSLPGDLCRRLKNRYWPGLEIVGIAQFLAKPLSHGLPDVTLGGSTNDSNAGKLREVPITILQDYPFIERTAF